MMVLLQPFKVLFTAQRDFQLPPRVARWNPTCCWIGWSAKKKRKNNSFYFFFTTEKEMTCLPSKKLNSSTCSPTGTAATLTGKNVNDFSSCMQNGVLKRRLYIIVHHGEPGEPCASPSFYIFFLLLLCC